MIEFVAALTTGILLGSLVYRLLRKWIESPGRCRVCKKRIPAEPRTWLCSYQGSSEKEVSLYYHEACHEATSRAELDAHKEAAWNR